MSTFLGLMFLLLAATTSSALENNQLLWRYRCSTSSRYTKIHHVS